MMTYVPVVTVMVKGLEDAEEGLAFTKRLVAFVESEGYAEDQYSIDLANAVLTPAGAEAVLTGDKT